MKIDSVKLKIKIIFWGLVFFSAPFSAVQASALYILPQSQNIYIGDSFLADVSIDTGEEEINAIEGAIIFPEEKLEVIDVIKGDSIIGLWIKEPNYSSKKGEIYFSGGMPKGFKGQGSIFKINFRTRENTGNKNFAEVFFKDNLRVFLNDGRATPAKNEVLSGTYNIISRTADELNIVSVSHPDINKWYSNNVLNLHWDIKEDAQYSYILSKDALTEADDIPDRPEGELQWMGDMKYEGLEDGIYYFYVKEKPFGENWNRNTVFRSMIDTTPPEKLTAEIAEIEGKRYAVFSAQDASSGIDHFEISESGNKGYFGIFSRREGDWKIAANPYLLENQTLSDNIKVKAVDKAGNQLAAEIFSKPEAFSYRMIVLILLAFAALFWVFFKLLSKFKYGKG